MYRFKLSLFTFIAAIVLMTACQQQESALPIKKLSNSSIWKKTKKTEELRYEGPHNFYEYHHRIRTREGEANKKPCVRVSNKVMLVIKN